MAPLAKLKPLALDSNLPLDLAADLDAAHTFREVFLERGYRLFVPLTVVTELTLLEEDESDAKKAALLREWDIEPFDLKSVEHGIAGEFARRLIAQGLLPDDEFNDGVILAESSLAKIPVPVTSDHHLLDISPEDLQPEFIAADLAPVTIAHPKSLLRALR